MGRNLQDEIERAQARVKELKKKQREEKKREHQRIGEILLKRLEATQPDVFKSHWAKATKLREIEKRDRAEYARMMAEARYERDEEGTSSEDHEHGVHD